MPEDPLLALTSAAAAGGSSVGSRVTSSPSKDFGSGEVDLDEINRLASATFNAETLDTCKFCGRTFLAEKLVIHNRSCTVDNPARRVNEAVKKGQKEIIQEPPRTAPAGSRRVKFTRTASMKKASVSGEEDVEGEEEEYLAGTSDAKEKQLIKRSDEPKSRPAAVAQEDNEDDTMSMGATVNLQIQNGSMTVVQGSMGGSGARSIRKQQQLQSSSPSPSRSDAVTGSQRSKAIELIASFQDKQEVIGYLTENLAFMENTALGLIHSISEMKDLLKELSGQN